jgi:hypothetical protein
MTYTMDDFRREYAKVLDEERQELVSAEWCGANPC